VRRTVVAGSIALAALLSFVSVLTSPSAAPILGIELFLFSQVFWAIGLVGLGHLASTRSPILGTLGAVFAGLGAFGHTVFGGVRLLQFSLAPNADAAAAAFEVSESAAFIPFLALGLLGTVLGYALLAVAIMRSRVAPLWVAIGLLVWLVAEFVLSNFTEWSSYASVTIGVIVFGALTVAIWRSPISAWTTDTEATAGALPRSTESVKLTSS
jgi:hypothetical protein